MGFCYNSGFPWVNRGDVRSTLPVLRGYIKGNLPSGVDLRLDWAILTRKGIMPGCQTVSNEGKHGFLKTAAKATGLLAVLSTK
jgi:hypothetical protein